MEIELSRKKKEAFEYAKAMQKEAEYRGLIESEKKGEADGK